MNCVESNQMALEKMTYSVLICLNLFCIKKNYTYIFALSRESGEIGIHARLRI